MYNASDNYSKTSGRDEPALDNNNAITNFNTINFTTNLFKIKEKITFKMPLVNCEIYLDLNQSKKFIIAANNVAEQGAAFSIIDTKLDVSVVTLSTQDNVKLLEQLKSGFKITINWNKINKKYQQKDQIKIQTT